MRRLTMGAGGILLGVLLLAGCGGSGTDATLSADTAGSAPVPAAEMAGAGAPGTVDTAKSPVGQQVITTAWMTLTVESVAQAVDDVESLVTGVGGSIAQQDLSSTDGIATATITARVPAAMLDRFLDSVGALGAVQSTSRQAADVTQQTIDLDARISALTASVDRLKELLAQSGTVADLVAVETELANRQAELDSLVAQRAYLADQVAMSTATITLSPVVTGGGWQAPGFLGGLQNGVNALIGLAGAAVTALGFLLPFGLLLGVIVIPSAWVIMRRARRHQD